MVRPLRILFACVMLTLLAPASAVAHGQPGKPPALPHGAVKQILVVELENEDFDTSFGPASPARYLNDVLVRQGVLLQNYYATGHASTTTTSRRSRGRRRTRSAARTASSTSRR